jgi:hypothetical protein
MVNLATKLVQTDAVPATLHYADGGQDGPLELQHVQVDDGLVSAAIYAQSGGTRSLARITGSVDDELELQIPTERADFDSLEAFLDAEAIFDTARTVTDSQTHV